jgi:hypothetical protein
MHEGWQEVVEHYGKPRAGNGSDWQLQLYEVTTCARRRRTRRDERLIKAGKHGDERLNAIFMSKLSEDRIVAP